MHIPTGFGNALLRGRLLAALTARAGRSDLVWLALSVILISGVALAIVLAHLRAQALDSGERLTASFAQGVEEQTSRTLQSVDLQLQLTLSHLAERRWAGVLGAREAHDLLAEQIRDLPFLREIQILDAQGRVVYGSDPEHIGVDHAERAYVQIYRQQPFTRFYLGDPEPGHAPNMWAVNAARPVFGADGELQNVIVASIEAAYFERLWRTLELGRQGLVTLFRRNGQLMVRTPHEEAGINQDFSAQPLFQQYLPKSAEGSFRQVSPIDGEDRLYAYRTLSVRPDLVLAVGQSVERVLQPWRQQALLALAVWLLGAAAVLLVCLFLRRAWHQQRAGDLALREMGQRLTLATEAAGIGVWDWDVEHDNWYATPTYFTMLGYAPEDGSGSRAQWMERIHPEDRQHVAEQIALVLSMDNADYQYEARARDAGGEYRWVNVTGRVLARDASGKPLRMIGVRTDISQRKKAEQEQRQVFERITDAYVAMDRNLHYTHVNPQAAQMLRRSAASLIGKNVWSEFPDLVGHPAQLLLQQALVDLRPVQMESYFPSFGLWFELRVFPSVEGLTVYFHDVTQRREAAESLAESEARYRELFEANPHPMWVYEVATLKFMAVNDAAVTHYGYSRAEFESMTIRDIRPSADVPQLLESVKRAPDRPLREMELWRHRCKDGRLILVEITGHSLHYMGRPARLILAHDVTERERTAERLRLSEESLSITLQSIGDAVIATDTSGRITRMNATAERLTGWTFPDAVGRPLGEVFCVVHAETRRPVANPVQRVLADGEVVGLANHTTLLARGGAQYQISNNGAPIRDGSGHIVGVVLVFSDATEAYRVRQALATSVELLERTGEMAKVGGWELDVAAQRSTWTLATARIYDAPESPSYALDYVMTFFDPPVRDTVRAAVQAAMDDATPWDMELPVTTARGRHIWVRSQGFPVVQNGSVTHIRGALHDITERRLAVDELRTASARTQMILDNMSDGVITLDAEGRIGSLNRAASAIFGYAPEEVVGRGVSVLMADSVAVASGGRGEAILNAGSSAPRELQGRRQDGTLFPMSLSLSRSEQDDAVAFIGVVRDITQQRADMEEIRRLAFSDLLTGLPNRRLLMDRLRLAVATSTRNGQHAALMLLDLDNFKLLNDTAGHDVGDILLQQVADRLLHSVRECDSVARLGGDEFVVLLEGLHAQGPEAGAQAEHVAEKILSAFKAPFRLRDQTHESTTSIGIVVFHGDGESLDDLMKKADLAMYQAKAAGRNNARFFDPAMQAAVAAHEARERALRRGIAQQEFVLHYQMQINRAGHCTGVEALVRWQDPLRGMVAPGHFIPLAEETGLILPLGRWVLETACAQLVAWAADAHTAAWTMAVNVSASQFAQSDFVQEVAQALNKVGAVPGLLKLELTESMLVEDVEDAIVKMNQIKALGVGFSLDDFGTGYSSLSYLKRLPLDQLKIDQSFVRDILTDPSDAVIARTVVALGQSLGLRVIAEGVETAAQLEALANMGCDGFQGYYFGRPCAVEGLQTSAARLVDL